MSGIKTKIDSVNIILNKTHCLQKKYLDTTLGHEHKCISALELHCRNQQLFIMIVFCVCNKWRLPFLSWNGYCKCKYKWCQQLKPLNKQFQALSLSCASSLFACSLFLAWSWFLADSPCTRASSEDESPKWKRKATTHVDIHHYWFGIKCYISCTSLNKINSAIKMFPILITRSYTILIVIFKTDLCCIGLFWGSAFTLVLHVYLACYGKF